MTIKEELNRQIKHIGAKITALEAYSPTKTEESILANYWCGRQAATTTTDFIETLYNNGIINEADFLEYSEKVRTLYRLLQETYNSL